MTIKSLVYNPYTIVSAHFATALSWFAAYGAIGLWPNILLGACGLLLTFAMYHLLFIRQKVVNNEIVLGTGFIFFSFIVNMLLIANK